MSYDTAFERLNNKLNYMVQEAVDKCVGLKASKDNTKQIKERVEEAYSKFYDYCTMAEKEMLDLIHPKLLEAEVECYGPKANVRMRLK